MIRSCSGQKRTPANQRHTRPIGLWRLGVIATAVVALAADSPSRDGRLPAPQEKAPPPSASSPVDYALQIQPILSTRCYRCHGPDKQSNDLRLDLKTSALRGGASGAVIVPRQSARSLLIQYVSGSVEDKVMPPKGDRLTAEQIALLRTWIDQGAVWPDPDRAAERLPEQQHWAFKALSRPALPEPGRPDWERNSIDRFILRGLAAAGLSPSPGADKPTLLRRLYFTLTGLPPAPEDAQRFLTDESDAAYANLVERLLASPRYGERWARHWLDVVRFAESAGFETNLERPNAWPYRDYVIDAFNQDKPYDRFVLEQLAGDVLGVDAATGFLVGGPDDAVKSPDINLTAQQRMDELHDMVATTSSAFLGLTVGCARCHNHKFDPIAQSDYYSMQAIFAGVQHGERPIRPADYAGRSAQAEVLRKRLAGLESELAAFIPVANPYAFGGASSLPANTNDSVLRPPVHPRHNIDRFASVDAQFVRFTILETTGGEPCLDELEIYGVDDPAVNIALASQGVKATASGTYSGDEKHKIEHLNDGRVGNSRSWISNEPGKGWVQLELSVPARIDRVVWGRDREGKFADRLATRYRLETALTPGDWRLAASSDDREPYKPGADPRWVNWPGDRHDSESECLRTLLSEKKQIEEQLKRLTNAPVIYAGRFEQPGPTFRLQRGEPLQKMEQVSPAAVHGFGPELSLPADTPEQQRRMALARWIIDPKNPLPARVLVNRLWQHHFGQGLVATPSDFGHMGARPTHPELLDWLATEFVASGWSIKHVQRLIVMSAAFRQSSQSHPSGLAADAGSRLLWRYPPRRLEAEPLRDAILAVSGNLNLRAGGPGFDLFQPNGNYVKVYTPKTEFGPAEWRRMVYQSKPRMRLDDTFGAFDCPDAGQVAPRRNVSTTPLQALNLLNSPFVLQQAGCFAKRLEREAGDAPADQVRRAFLLAFGRLPSSTEFSAAIQTTRDHGLHMVCRTLFNANEFSAVF